MEPLPEHIADLIREGRKLDAIKLIREETGVGLAEAKEAVERLAAGLDPRPAPQPAIAEGELPPGVEALARLGNKIAAIKLLRERTGMGLAEAKARVEAIPGVPAGPTANGCGAPVLAIAVVLLLFLFGVIAAVFFATAG